MFISGPEPTSPKLGFNSFCNNAFKTLFRALNIGVVILFLFISSLFILGVFVNVFSQISLKS